MLLCSKNKKIIKTRHMLGRVLNENILIKEGQEKIVVLNQKLQSLRDLELKTDILLSSSYINQARNRVILYDDENTCLYHINLKTTEIEKFEISDGSIFTSFYEWNNNLFCLVDNMHRVYKFDLGSGFNLLSIDNTLEQYPFLKKLVDYNLTYRILFFDSSLESLIYRTEGEGINLIYLFDPIKKANIKFEAFSEDIHSADYRDDFIALVHEEQVVFYCLDREVFKLTIDKKHWVFRSARLIKDNNILYCMVLSFNVCDPAQNSIDIYKIRGN